MKHLREQEIDFVDCELFSSFLQRETKIIDRTARIDRRRRLIGKILKNQDEIEEKMSKLNENQSGSLAKVCYCSDTILEKTK